MVWHPSVTVIFVLFCCPIDDNDNEDDDADDIDDDDDEGDDADDGAGACQCGIELRHKHVVKSNA